MSIPFLRLELNRLLWCQAGAAASTMAVLTRRHFAGDGPTEVLSIEPDGSLSFAIPRRLHSGIGPDDVHPALAGIVPQAVARIVLRETKTTQVYREYRLRSPITDGTAERGIVSVKCDPLILDLAKCGPMREVVNGLNNFTFDLADNDVADIAAFVVAKAGFAWLGVGATEPTYTFDTFPIERLTPLAGAGQLRDQLRERDIPCEYALEQGVAGYELAFRSQIGAGLQLAPFTLKAGQLGVRRTIDPTQQVTRAWVTGGTDPDGIPGIGGRARWVVGTVTATTFEVGDPNGGAPPIAIDGQYVTPTAWYVYRVRTGETWPIVGTTAGADPGDPAVIEVATTGSLVAGELIEFRVNEPGTNTRYEQWTKPLEHQFYEISAIDAGAKTVTLAEPWTASDPVSVDGQFDGRRARCHTKVGGPIVGTANAAGDYYAIADVSPYQLDDWLIPAQNAAAPYARVGNQLLGTISGIDGGLNRLTVVARYEPGVDPVTISQGYNGLRLYRPLRDDRVRATDAASNKVTLDSVAGLAVGDVVEFDQPDGAGELPVYVDHPIYAQALPTGFGVQSGELEKTSIAGLQELGTNPFFTRWAGAATDPPDGLSKTGVIARNTDPLYTRYGPKSIYVATWNTATVTSERFYPSSSPGRDRVSVRAWLYFTSFFSDPTPVGSYFMLAVYACTPAGAATGTPLGYTYLYAPDNPTASAEQKPVLNAWMSVAIKGITVPMNAAHYGLVCVLSCGSGPCAGYLDAIDKWGHADVPEVPVEFGDAHRLVQAGNRHVRDWGYPVKYDLAAQLLPDVNRRLDLAMGGTIPIILRGYGIDVTQRLLRAEIAHFHPDRAQCSLARRAQLLTDFVPGG